MRWIVLPLVAELAAATPPAAAAEQVGAKTVACPRGGMPARPAITPFDALKAQQPHSLLSGAA